MSEAPLDTLDRQLIHALQIKPRASWGQIAHVLHSSPVTVARRWAALEDRGLVWVSTAPSRTFFEATAIVEIDSNDPLQTAEHVLEDEECFGAPVVSGGRDLLLMVHAYTMEAFTNYVLRSLRRAPGVTRMRTHLVGEVISPINNWRLRELNSHQLAMMNEIDAPAADAGVLSELPTEFDLEIGRVLRCNGRASAVEVARVLGEPVRRVRPRLAHLLRTGAFELRADIAHSYSEWPISAWFMLSVPSAELNQVAGRLNRMREIRTVLTTIGPFNLTIAVWLRQSSDVIHLESLIVSKLPNVTVVDRTISLMPLKRVGVSVDSRGLRIRKHGLEGVPH